MTKVRILLVLAVLSVLLVWPSGSVRAECASLPSLEAALEDAPGAFIGEVSEARFDLDQATIRVLWIWKGRDLPKEIVVQTPFEVTSSGESGFRFRAGATYIVMMQDSVAPFTVNECSGTRMYRADGEAIPSDFWAAVGAEMGHRPGDKPARASENAKGAGYSPLVVVVTGFAGLIAVASYRLRGQSVATKGKLQKVRRLNGLSSTGRSGRSQLGRIRRRGKR